MIYHVTTVNNWNEALLKGYFEVPSLLSEGFMHASHKHQVNGVLQRYYKDQKDLLLLHIAETKLTAPLKFELALSINEEFPHIYGKLNLEAVVKVERIFQN